MRSFKNRFFLKNLRIGGLSLLFTGLVSMGMAQTPIPYEQDFENDTLGAWQSYSVASNEDWQWGSFGGDGFATVNGFQANENSNDWLISPRFDFSAAQDSVFFRFNNAKNFGDGGLKLLISSNYDGESNPDSSIFNWKDITNRADLVKQQGYVDTPSGRISINDFPNEDSVYIAFQYTATPSNATLWQLDDFEVFEKSEFTQLPYEQDFENVNGLDDWLSVSLASEKDWSRTTFSGTDDHYAEMNGFGSDTLNHDWLISPGFDLSGVSTDYFFSFASTYNFSGDTFKVKVSTNYDGQSDPTMAQFNWTDITNEFQISQGNNNEVPSGGYNLSAFNGDTLHIAFQYKAPEDNGGRMQIDDIRIQKPQPLIINEVLANNQNVNTDENGENDSWVELYNPNGKDVNLDQYNLSDESNDRSKYELPDTAIESKDYLIVWADDQDGQGELHTNFSLDAGGDDLFLTSNRLGPVDSVSFGSQNPDTAFGRLPNETGDFQQTFPTPEADNQRLLPAYDIGEVTTVDPQSGEVDSLGVSCKITGIIHGFNRRTDGYEVSLQDSTGGIGLFEFSNVSGYTPEEGDKITVRGEIGQFNGLAQLRPDSIRVVSQDNELYDPVVTDALSEDTEAVLTTLEDYTIIDTSQWGGSSAFNVDITNGTDTFIIRIDEAAPLINQGPALGYFDVTGEGWQFDGSEPYFGGYQVFPESTEAFRYDTNLVVNEFLAVNNNGEEDALGEQDPWIELYNKGDEALNPSAYLVSDGSGAKEGSRLPDTTIQPGERLTIWADGDALQQGIHTNFALSSDGGTITLATPYGDVFETVEYGPQGADTSLARDPEGTGDFTTATPTFDSANDPFTGLASKEAPALNLYPNPVQDQLTIQAEEASFRVQVINSKGQIVQQQRVLDSKARLYIGQRPAGLYLIRMQGLNDDWQVTRKVINTQ